MKKIILTAVLMTLLGAGCGTVNQPTVKIPDLPKDQIILFVGKDCPHCEIVENKLKSDYSKLPIATKEVFENGSNAALLVQAIKTCGLSLATAGVPLLWDGQACHEGDSNILNFLRNYEETSSKLQSPSPGSTPPQAKNTR